MYIACRKYVEGEVEETEACTAWMVYNAITVKPTNVIEISMGKAIHYAPTLPHTLLIWSTAGCNSKEIWTGIGCGVWGWGTWSTHVSKTILFDLSEQVPGNNTVASLQSSLPVVDLSCGWFHSKFWHSGQISGLLSYRLRIMFVFLAFTGVISRKSRPRAIVMIPYCNEWVDEIITTLPESF